MIHLGLFVKTQLVLLELWPDLLDLGWRSFLVGLDCLLLEWAQLVLLVALARPL